MNSKNLLNNKLNERKAINEQRKSFKKDFSPVIINHILKSHNVSSEGELCSYLLFNKSLKTSDISLLSFISSSLLREISKKEKDFSARCIAIKEETLPVTPDLLSKYLIPYLDELSLYPKLLSRVEFLKVKINARWWYISNSIIKIKDSAPTSFATLCLNYPWVKEVEDSCDLNKKKREEEFRLLCIELIGRAI